MARDTGTLDTGNGAAVREERDDFALPVKGELPRELSGTLFRNGPNPQFDTPDAHWFVGDGMLHAFTLDNGKASYRNRWVRTRAVRPARQLGAGGGLSEALEVAMKTIVLGLAIIICGGVALMPLLVQPDPGSVPPAAALAWLTTALMAR